MEWRHIQNFGETDLFLGHSGKKIVLISVVKERGIVWVW